MTNEIVQYVQVPLQDWQEIKETMRKVSIYINEKEKDFITLPEACKSLSISRNTLERYINKGLIEVVNIDKSKKYTKRLIARTEIERFTQANV